LPILKPMLRPGHLVALCVLALLTLGVIMVNSAGMSVDPKQAVTLESILLSRPTAYMVGALAAMAVCASLPIRRLVPAGLRSAQPGAAVPLELDLPPARPGLLGEIGRMISVWLRLAPMWACVAAMLFVLALVYVPGIGKQVNGSARWLRLPIPGLESFQPSEIAKWGLIALLAVYGARFAGRLERFWVGLAPALAASGAVAALIVKEDLGTGALVGLVAGLMLIAAGAKLWHLGVLMPLPLAGVALAIMTSDYRRDRMLAFLDPYQHPQTIGYHMIQSMVAVANGHVSGRGLGHGLQKFDFLPEDQTDFIFAIVCEELGVVGCVLVLVLIGALIWNAVAIARSERWPVLRLFALGVVATVGFQAVINLFVVTGLGPTKGIALPLLSSGGTGWLLTAASLGLLIAMDRTQGTAERYEVSREDLLARARVEALRRRERFEARETARREAREAAAREKAAARAARERARIEAEARARIQAEYAAQAERERLELERAELERARRERVEREPSTPEAGASSGTIAGVSDEFDAGGPARLGDDPQPRPGPTAESGSIDAQASLGASAAEPAIGSSQPGQASTPAEALIETPAVTAQAGSATATSRLTILTTPGEQGWLLSASSMPVTSSSVTLLGPDPAPAPKPATGEGSSVVVTKAGRDWTGGEDRADGAAEPRAQQA